MASSRGLEAFQEDHDRVLRWQAKRRHHGPEGIASQFSKRFRNLVLVDRHHVSVGVGEIWKHFFAKPARRGLPFPRSFGRSPIVSTSFCPPRWRRQISRKVCGCSGRWRKRVTRCRRKSSWTSCLRSAGQLFTRRLCPIRRYFLPWHFFIEFDPSQVASETNVK